MLRILVVKPGTDLEKVLLRRSGAASNASFEHVKALNPHVESFEHPCSRHRAGGARRSGARASKAVGGEDFKDLNNMVDAGLKDAAKRVRAGFEQLDADHRAISGALKTAALKRQIGEDPALKKQLQAAEAQFKADQQRADEVESQLADAHKLAMKELAALQKLFGG